MSLVNLPLAREDYRTGSSTSLDLVTASMFPLDEDEVVNAPLPSPVDPTPTTPRRIPILPPEILSLIVDFVPSSCPFPSASLHQRQLNSRDAAIAAAARRTRMMETMDRYKALSETNQLFYQLCRLPFLIDFFSSGGGFNRLFRIEEAEPGDLGYAPFSVDRPTTKSSEGTREGRLTEFVITIREYKMEEMRKREPAERHFALQMTDNSLTVDTVYNFLSGFDSAWTSHSVPLADLQGKIVLATVDLIRERFTCPECNNGRRTRYHQNEDVAIRWPELDGLPNGTIDCPRCTTSPYTIMRTRDVTRSSEEFYRAGSFDEDDLDYVANKRWSGEGEEDDDDEEEEEEEEEDEERAEYYKRRLICY